MIYLIILILVLVLIVGFSKGLEDGLNFHPDKYPLLSNRPFFNRKTSWKRKWKNGNKKEGEKFLGSSTIFVFVTDYFHLSQFVRITSLVLIATMFTGIWWMFFIIRISFWIGFKVVYK